MRTAELGCRVSFTTAIDLARKLSSALAENRLHRELKNLTRSTLLIIDEVGYLQLDPTQASLLFQVICKRYETNHSIILTSNKAFADWSHVFAADPIMASAALDRLLHRATAINIKCESYRLKDRRLAAPPHRLNPLHPVVPHRSQTSMPGSVLNDPKWVNFKRALTWATSTV